MCLHENGCSRGLRACRFRYIAVIGLDRLCSCNVVHANRHNSDLGNRQWQGEQDGSDALVPLKVIRALATHDNTSRERP